MQYESCSCCCCCSRAVIWYFGNRRFEKTHAEWFGTYCKRCRKPKVTTSRAKDAHKQDKCNKLLTFAVDNKKQNCNAFF